VTKAYILALTPIEIPEAERKLVAWWKFDESEGDTLSDSSGNNHSGALVGGPQWQPAGGKTAGALAFDGVDDCVDCGSNDDLNLAKGVSVSAWIKLAEPAKDQKIVSNQDNVSGGYKVSLYDNKLELEIRDVGNIPSQNRSVGGGTVLEPDVWYHVVSTYSQGGGIKTYVNGKLDRELGVSGMLAPSAGTVKIGCEPFEDAYWFKGLMDDLQIYNYPLSEDEVASLYAGQPPLVPVVAQIETPTDSAEPSGKTRSWIPIVMILAIAIVVGALVAAKKRTAS
jgi:hypothetical protein